ARVRQARPATVQAAALDLGIHLRDGRHVRAAGLCARPARGRGRIARDRVPHRLHRLAVRGRAARLSGRALAVFTMAMFLGIALMQWITGAVASLAHARHADAFTAVLLAIAAMLALGALAFALLPTPGPVKGRA